MGEREIKPADVWTRRLLIAGLLLLDGGVLTWIAVLTLRGDEPPHVLGWAAASFTTSLIHLADRRQS